MLAILIEIFIFRFRNKVLKSSDFINIETMEMEIKFNLGFGFFFNIFLSRQSELKLTKKIILKSIMSNTNGRTYNDSI